MGDGVESYAGGNIIIGGNGSDVLEGRGGDDILDGDKYLDVRLSVRTNPADPSSEVHSANSMNEPQADVFSGAIDPGNIVIVREILNGNGVGTDRALSPTPMQLRVRRHLRCDTAADDAVPARVGRSRITVSHIASASRSQGSPGQRRDRHRGERREG